MKPRSACVVVGLLFCVASAACGQKTVISVAVPSPEKVQSAEIIAEATVPKGYPAPLIFEQSLGWLDEQGRRVRYQYPYHNDPEGPKPLPRGGGR